MNVRNYFLFNCVLFKMCESCPNVYAIYHGAARKRRCVAYVWVPYGASTIGKTIKSQYWVQEQFPPWVPLCI